MRTMVARTFREIWGNESFGYQEIVAQTLLSGRNVVLVAPTGSGKTLAALHPFVHTRLNGLPWADRLVYALPLRTLAGALHADEKTYEGLSRAGLRATLQTGLNRGDPFFRGDVCFATIDQALSAYVGDPVSVPSRQANVVGAAFVGAYVVFDEFHLLETGRSLLTAIDLARRLRGFAPVLFMTATAPRVLAESLAEEIGGELVSPSEAEIAEMPAQAEKQRFFSWRPEHLTTEAILDRHLQSDRQLTVAVFNTVERAQEAFADLDKRLPSGHERLLLHSRFLPGDRRTKEEMALRLFAKGSAAKAVLVSTQVVEVGLNISCRNLLTEVSPASSLVQRAGRCARFEHEEGDVVIFGVPDGSSHPFAPYDQDECLATLVTIESRVGEGRVRADCHWEEGLVDQALRSADARKIEIIRAHLPQRRTEVANSLAADSQAAYRDLVRSVDATSVTIHDCPSDLDLRRGVETFSVSDSVLRGFVRSLDLQGVQADLVHYPAWNDTGDDEDEPLVREWLPLKGAGKVDLDSALHSGLLVMSPSVACYDERLGLRLGQAGSWRAGAPAHADSQPAPNLGKRRHGSEEGVAETFLRHALDVAKRLRELTMKEAAAALRTLSEALGVPEAALLTMFEGTGLFHDAGKLDVRWVLAIWRRQEEGGSPPLTSEDVGAAPSIDEASFLAHSSRRHGRLPPHAVQGACASYLPLKIVAEQALPDGARQKVLAACLAAIARHHQPHSAAFGGFEAHPQACGQIAALIERLLPGTSTPWSLKIEAHQGMTLMKSVLAGADPSNTPEWPLYWTIVRLLRLADQSSQEALAARIPAVYSTGVQSDG